MEFEAKPAEAKPAEAKPAEAKPAEAKQPEAKQPEAKPAEFYFEGKTYLFPKLEPEFLVQAVVDRLKELRRDPMDVVIDRYDDLKNKPDLLDRLLDRALRAKDPPPPSKEEVMRYMNSFDGQVWTLWWTLSKAYPDLTLATAQAMLIHEGAAQATKEMAARVG